MTQSAKVTINVNVSASLRLSGGATVSIDANTITISRPGPQGGKGDAVTVPVNEWDAVNEAVNQVRDAIFRAKNQIAP